jgi:acyl-coenzyme A thioesterase PaaI-like protein
VIRAGKTLSVCEAEGWAVGDAREKRVAHMTGTMMCVRDNPGLSG